MLKHFDAMIKDRFPARPYIAEGFPTNITAVVSETVMFNCPIIADIAAHIQWARYHAFNDTDGLGPSKINATRLEVFFLSFEMNFGDGFGFSNISLNKFFSKLNFCSFVVFGSPVLVGVGSIYNLYISSMVNNFMNNFIKKNV